MIATLDTPTGTHLPNKHLLDDKLWSSLVGRIAREGGIEPTLAGRIMNEALSFLQLVAAAPHAQFTPSSMVDTGWHTFLLYTREYAAFCEKVAGRFIHHVPFDDPGIDADVANVTRTIAALKYAGFVADEGIWVGAADCAGQKCYNGDCSNSRA
jgi:hypothetical protein